MNYLVRCPWWMAFRAYSDLGVTKGPDRFIMGQEHNCLSCRQWHLLGLYLLSQCFSTVDLYSSNPYLDFNDANGID